MLVQLQSEDGNINIFFIFIFYSDDVEEDFVFEVFYFDEVIFLSMVLEIYLRKGKFVKRLFIDY